MDVNVFQLQEFYARVGEIAQRKGQHVGRTIRGPIFYLTEEEMAECEEGLNEL